MRVHVFVDSGYTTLITDRPICRECGCVRDYRVHRVPERSDDERLVDARRVGERL